MRVCSFGAWYLRLVMCMSSRSVALVVKGALTQLHGKASDVIGNGTKHQDKVGPLGLQHTPLFQQISAESQTQIPRR